MDVRLHGTKNQSAGQTKMRARGSYKKSEASRKQVLDAAIRALAKNGYAKTSVNEIAITAGMSKGAVHYHFESKDDLIAQVLERCARSMAERARAAWEAPGEPRDKIRRAIREMWATRREGGAELRVLADLMAQGLHDPRLREPINGMFKTTRTEVQANLVRTLQEFGLTPKVAPHVIPRLLVSTLDGLALHNYFDPPADGDEEEILSALENIAFTLFEI